ncbi:hypothetical protein WDU94_003289 [Cyamophila willieti]
MVFIRLLLLVCFVYAVNGHLQTQDGADCNSCINQYKGECDVGTSPTSCISTSTGCRLYKWQQKKWVPYNYKVNCTACYAKAKDAEEGRRKKDEDKGKEKEKDEDKRKEKENKNEEKDKGKVEEDEVKEKEKEKKKLRGSGIEKEADEKEGKEKKKERGGGGGEGVGGRFTRLGEVNVSSLEVTLRLDNYDH